MGEADLGAVMKRIWTWLAAPQQAQGLRAIPPFALLLIAAAWFSGWGWWSVLAPFGFAAAVAAVLAPVILLTRGRGPQPARTLLKPLSGSDAAHPGGDGPVEGATLTALLGKPPAPFSDWIVTEAFIAAWGRRVPLRLILQDEAEVWPETIAAINAVQRWGKAERGRVIALLLADEREAGEMTGEPQRLTARTVEDAVLVESLDFVQADRARAGVGLLRLIPPWEDEHGVAVVIRDGQPAELINGLRDDPDEVFWI